ncbi:MAG TPA: hypothetical protein PKO06_22980, partial [Candidatus Ozemobacteraceae bacterium]|nr:hypothetical protein [Candidatus Ozemobacteraceae bacterium]
NLLPKANITLQVPETPWAIPYTGTTAELATLTIVTTPTTPTGLYTGEIIFWEDSTVNGSRDADEDAWALKVTLAVGVKDLEIIEPALDFGVVAKGSNSTTSSMTIRNKGTVFLSNTRVIPGSLTGGAGTIPPSDLHFGTLQVTPPNLNPGVTRAVSLYITAAAGLPSGIYTGAQRVFEDLNGNGAIDASEPVDLATVTVMVTSGGALGFEFFNNPGTVDFGIVARSGNATASFQIISLSGSTLSNLQYQKADLMAGPTPLSQANLTFSPAPGYSIPPFATSDATATVTIPPLQLAGTYIGQQWVVDADHLPGASAPLILTVTVPPASLSVSPTTVDFGYQAPGANASTTFTIQNLSANALDIDIVKSPLLRNGVGPESIPITDLSFAPQLWNLQGPPAVPNSTLATLGVMIDATTLPGTYLGTCTFRDLTFPGESQAQLSVLL